MLKNARFYDLLDSAVYLALSQNPGRIAEEMSSEDHIVVIDEIQSEHDKELLRLQPKPNFFPLSHISSKRTWLLGFQYLP
jgi:hypothetical protein